MRQTDLARAPDSGRKALANVLVGGGELSPKIENLFVRIYAPQCHSRLHLQNPHKTLS